MLILPCMKPIENSNLRDWSFIRRINGQTSLKERRLTYDEKLTLPRKSRKKLPRNLRNYEESVAKKQIEQDKQELMRIVHASREESYDCESVLD